MTDQDTLQPNSAGYGSVSGLLILGGLVLVGLVTGQALGMALASTRWGLNFETFGKLLETPLAHPELWLDVMLIQGLAALFGFVLAPTLYWQRVARSSWHNFKATPPPTGFAYGLVVLVVIAAMPFNGWVIYLNKSMVLPEWLSGVEQWMRQKEDSLADLTKFLTTLRYSWQLVVALVVVAVIPALGEELLFRGIIQTLLTRASHSHHVGIWASAALFSATHLQFYGFVPRLLLGVLFGYLYYWSRDLRIPILAHFINNGFSLVMLYLFQQKITQLNVEDSPSVPYTVALGSLLVTSLLLLSFWRQSKSINP